MDKYNGRPGACRHAKTYKYLCMPLTVGGRIYDRNFTDAIGLYSFQRRIHRSFINLDTKPNRQLMYLRIQVFSGQNQWATL